ncbi:MAG: hypothetical protein JWN44_5860 [Myxococcales bacterium]|nr:hypothetical protein [Myxococcales bacterium]
MPLDLSDLDKIATIVRNAVKDELTPALADDEPVELANRWSGGKLEIWPRDQELGAKEIPIDVFFHKIVMLRDRLRVLEQQINGHAKLDDADKVHLQQYVTRCYGSLTTFNVLFRHKEDGFTGSGTGGKED